MKVKITLIGLLTVFAGILPIINRSVTPLPFPTEGYIYYGIIIAIGLIDLLYSFIANIDLIGLQHFVTALIALMTIFGGILPFISKFIGIPEWLISGLPHNLMIIAIGVIGLAYGISQLRY